MRPLRWKRHVLWTEPARHSAPQLLNYSACWPPTCKGAERCGRMEYSMRSKRLSVPPCDPNLLRRCWRSIPMVLYKGFSPDTLWFVRLINAFTNARNWLVYTHSRLLRNLFPFPNVWAPSHSSKAFLAQISVSQLTKALGSYVLTGCQLPCHLHIFIVRVTPRLGIYEARMCTVVQGVWFFHTEFALLHCFLLRDMVLLTLIWWSSLERVPEWYDSTSIPNSLSKMRLLGPLPFLEKWGWEYSGLQILLFFV